MLESVQKNLYTTALMGLCFLSTNSLSQEFEKPQLANVTLQYSTASWDPGEMANAESETAGKNLIIAEIDLSPSLFFLAPIKYWTTPGNKVDQKELIDAVEDGTTAFERITGGFNF